MAKQISSEFFNFLRDVDGDKRSKDDVLAAAAHLLVRRVALACDHRPSPCV